jgi:hypothetical protein
LGRREKERESERNSTPGLYSLTAEYQMQINADNYEKTYPD